MFVRKFLEESHVALEQLWKKCLLTNGEKWQRKKNLPSSHFITWRKVYKRMYHSAQNKREVCLTLVQNHYLPFQGRVGRARSGSFNWIHLLARGGSANGIQHRLSLHKLFALYLRMAVLSWHPKANKLLASPSCLNDLSPPPEYSPPVPCRDSPQEITACFVCLPGTERPGFHF